MTYKDISLLAPDTPTSSVSTEITIGHVQLRDLVICPHERGVVNYLHGTSIYEHDLFRPGSKRVLANLPFVPNTLTALPIPDSTHTLLAAGGQDADLHLSMHSSTTSPSSHRRGSRPHWQYDTQLHGSINNSVMLTSLSLTKSNVSSVEPRVAVSNNDCSVKFYDVNIRGAKSLDSSSSDRLKEIGLLKIDVPVNHSSVSPDGSTLLSVGDSPQVHLHHLSGSSRLTFKPIATYSLAPYTPAALSHQFLYSHYTSSTLPASFSTSFSPNGMKFAVASQEGVAVVWDVRSSKPLKVYETDKNRGKERRPTGEGSGWLYEEDMWDWSTGGSRAPGWGIRSIKFSPAGCDGREIMTFTEHTSLLHVIDARTFETEEVIRIPDPLNASVRSSLGHRPTRSESAIMNNVSTTHPQVVVSPSISGSTTEEEDEDGLVTIPRLGSNREEEDVRQLLGRHGIRAARPRRRPILSPRRQMHPEDEDMDMTDVERARGGEEVEMDIDDLETECLSSAGGSRAGSPIPMPAPTAHSFVTSAQGASSISAVRGNRDYLRPRGMRSISSTVSGTRTLRPPPPYPAPALVAAWARREEVRESSPRAEDTLDLAGTCFDPTGSYIYVGSVKGVVEYRVRGTDKMWWVGSQWA